MKGIDIRNWIKKSIILHRRVGKQFKFKISEMEKLLIRMIMKIKSLFVGHLGI